MGGIATRVALFSSLIVLVATATVGFLVYRGAKDSLIRSASDRVAHTAETVKVGAWGMSGALGDDVRFLAETPPVQGIVRARLRRGLDPVTAIRDDEWGEQLAYTFRAFLESRSSFLQARLIAMTNDRRELVRVDRREGQAVFADPSELRRLGDAHYVKQAAELPPRGLFFSEVHWSEGADNIPVGVPYMTISTPVYAESGSVFGVIDVTVDFRGITGPMESLVDGSQSLYVAGDDGEILHTYTTGSERPLALRRVQDQFPSVEAVLDTSTSSVRMLDANVNEFSQGIAYFEMIQMSSVSGSPRLLIGVSEPHETILAGVRRVRNTSALITLLLCIAAVTISVMMSRYITDPIRQIAKAVSAFGEDGDPVALPAKRDDEIGLLARSFDSMQRQIQDQIRILEDEEQRQRTILETAAEGMIVVRSDGRIETFNNAAESIFDVSADAAVGRHIEEMMPHIDFASGTVEGRPIRAGSRETMGMRADGTEVPLLVVWSLFKWQDEDRYTFFVQDISERKAAEEAQDRLVHELENERMSLRELSRSLEVRVHERTAELERLNRELKSTNRELGEIASVATHDLQEPLRKLRSFADLLETEYGDRVDDDGRFYVRRIYHLAERMSSLLNDLMAFSSVTAQTMAVRPIDMRNLALEVVDTLEGTITETGAEVHVEELPEIEADPRQMRQLLDNLLKNALEYRRPETTPVVCLRGRVLEDAAGRQVCRIEVQDNGMGFDEKYTERIFAPFQRLHGRRGPEGTGMGLTICRRIVENHLGTITAHSKPGAGSTFVVMLPVQGRA